MLVTPFQWRLQVCPLLSALWVINHLCFHHRNPMLWFRPPWLSFSAAAAPGRESGGFWYESQDEPRQQPIWLFTKDLPLRMPSRKLAPRLIVPYRITRVVNPVAIRLNLPPALGRVHPVFHVSRVKPVFSSPLNPADDRPTPAPSSCRWLPYLYG